jgi:hypothetical protein
MAHAHDIGVLEPAIFLRREPRGIACGHACRAQEQHRRRGEVLAVAGARPLQEVRQRGATDRAGLAVDGIGEALGEVAPRSGGRLYGGPPGDARMLREVPEQQLLLPGNAQVIGGRVGLDGGAWAHRGAVAEIARRRFRLHRAERVDLDGERLQP